MTILLDDDVTILMCAQKLTDASLIYCTEPENKTEKKRTKNKKGYWVCSEETVPGQKRWSQSGVRKRESRVVRICETGRVENEVAGVGRYESELEWLV